MEYPKVHALRAQFNWMQHKLLVDIPAPSKREYYELEAANNNWTAREMEHHIHSQLYERLLLSNDKESVLAIARKERNPQTPQEIIKDPMVLELLGLDRTKEPGANGELEKKPQYYEYYLENALKSHLQ